MALVPPTAPRIGASMVPQLGAPACHHPAAASPPPAAGTVLAASSAMEWSPSSSSAEPNSGTTNDKITPSTERHCTTQHQSTAIPCLLLPEALHDHDENRGNSSLSARISSRRILLQGPSKSGRTSLAMNLAYACAAAATGGLGRGGAESGAAATSTTTTPPPPPCHCLLQPCRCISVVVYRRRKAVPPASLEDFPLPCRYCSSGDPRDIATGKNVSYHRQQQQSTITKKTEEEQEETSPWDPTILRRIRIKYVGSARDILQDLLGLLGKPLHEHPTRAILIDDLDLICGGGDDDRGDGCCEQEDPNFRRKSSGEQHDRIWGEQQHNHRRSSGSEIAISTMQTLAVAVDTCHALQRLHGTLPLILSSVSSRTNIVAPWMDTIVTLSSSSSSSSSATPRGSATTSKNCPSQWTADFRGTATSGSKTWSAVVDYSVVVNRPLEGDGPSIEWKLRPATASVR